MDCFINGFQPHLVEVSRREPHYIGSATNVFSVVRIASGNDDDLEPEVPQELVPPSPPAEDPRADPARAASSTVSHSGANPSLLLPAAAATATLPLPFAPCLPDRAPDTNSTETGVSQNHTVPVDSWRLGALPIRPPP